jgi:hypothetical protein
LENAIRRLAAEGIFTRLRDPFTESLDNGILARILHLVSIPQETRGKYAGPVDLVQAMIRWIDFADLSELVDEYGETDAKFQNPLFVSDVVYRHFMNDAPWALNSVIKLLTYLRDEENLKFDPEIGLIPSYVKYGVNTAVAAYVSGIGISDREIARIMADYYYREVSPALLPSVKDFQEWVQGLTFEDLLPILQDHHLVQEVMSILRRYYVVGLRYENRLEYLSQVNQGGELKLVREPDNAFDPYAMAVYTNVGQKLGYIRSSKAFVLSTLSDEGWRFNCYVERMYPAPRHPNYRLLVHIPPPLPF